MHSFCPIPAGDSPEFTASDSPPIPSRVAELPPTVVPGRARCIQPLLMISIVLCVLLVAAFAYLRL